jgi:hypothetical protein
VLVRTDYYSRIKKISLGGPLLFSLIQREVGCFIWLTFINCTSLVVDLFMDANNLINKKLGNLRIE